MEKGYFPTSLIKFQVENKTDISYIINKNLKIGDHENALRKFTEKPRQQYRYVKPHPSTPFRKETNAAEKTNIETKKTNIEPKTNYQNTLAEYARRLEILHDQLKQQQLVKKETKKKQKKNI